MMKIPCSVPILTYNSEKTLERCLESLKDFEEILLLDGGSNDRTLEIAKKFGCIIYPQTEGQTGGASITDFTAMRLRALSFTTKPWILHIDSDEYIQPELASIIRKITSQPTIDVKIAYNLPRFAIINGRLIKYSFASPDYYIRFYHKDSGVSFKPEKFVHEQRLIPNDVKIMQLENGICAPWPSYGECICKDNYYLSLLENKFKNFKQVKKLKVGLFVQFRAVIRNILIPIKIFLVSFWLGISQNSKDCLPPKYVWRFMRYHFLVAKLRLKYIFI